MILVQYVALFEKLARHATTIVPDEEAKGHRFEGGLDPLIMGRVIGMKLPLITDFPISKCQVKFRSINGNFPSKSASKVFMPLAVLVLYTGASCCHFSIG